MTFTSKFITTISLLTLVACLRLLRVRQSVQAIGR